MTCATDSIRTRFETYLDLVNRHRIEAVLDCLAPEFRLHFTEFDFSLGKAAIGDVLGWDRGVDGQVGHGELQIEKRTISGIFTERNEFFALLDIESLAAKVSYRFDESGKLVEQHYTPLPDQPSFQDRLAPAITWARDHAPDALELAYPGERMVFNEVMAERWVALLKRWRGATPDP